MQINSVLPYCVTHHSVITDPESLSTGTRRSRLPWLWVYDTVWAKLSLILTLPLCHYWHSVVRGGPLVAAEGGDLWTGALLLAHYYHNYYYLCIQRHSAWMGLKTQIQVVLLWGCHFHSLLITCCRYIIVGKYCTLRVHIIWLLNCQLPWSTVEIGFVYFTIWNKSYFKIMLWIILLLGPQKSVDDIKRAWKRIFFLT